MAGIVFEAVICEFHIEDAVHAAKVLRFLNHRTRRWPLANFVLRLLRKQSWARKHRKKQRENVWLQLSHSSSTFFAPAADQEKSGQGSDTISRLGVRWEL